MKKDSLLKALGIAFLIVVLLSWIIPAGTYSNGVYTSLEKTISIGLYDFVRVPVLTIATFIQYGLLFLAIGGFYGVLNQTGVYSNLVNNIAKKWDKNSKKFLIITVISFAVLTSLTGLTDLMFLLVPFFTAILFKLGYSKLTTFTSTVGSILVGNIGSTLGFNVWGYLKYYLSLEMTTLIFARIVLLFMAVALLIITLSKNIKEEKKSKEVKEIPLFEENKSKKSSMPLVVIAILLFVLLFVGGYNWYHSFEVETFNNLHESISTHEIGGKTWVNNILAFDHIPALGFFENYDVTIILIFASMLIGWIYNVKFKEVVSSFASGAKKMLLPATYAMLSCVIFACLLNMSSGNFINTIINKFVTNQEFSFLGTVGTSLVSGFVYNDFATLLGNIYAIFAAYDANVISIVALIIQGMFGFISLIAPTSIYLLAGLSLLDISYKEWIKYIWKYALIIFGLVIIVAFILTTLI